MPTTMKLQVECCPSTPGERAPCVFWLAGRQIDVQEVLDRWLGTDHSYYKVRALGEAVYILRHDRDGDSWELTFYLDTNQPLTQLLTSRI